MSDKADHISMEASEWLIRLREAPDDRDLERRFIAWRDADPDHLQAWSEMQALFDLIGDIEARHPEYLAPASNPPPAYRASRPRRLWKAAAISAIAACLAILVGPALLLRMQADHMTAAGHLANIRLDDGSRVHLGPDSAIAVAYSMEHRDVRLLKGQAWFEVHPDKSRPFRVRTDRISATALGTAFDVRMIGTDRSVAVGHGRVRIDESARNDSTQAAPKAVLNAGDWIAAVAGKGIDKGHQASDLAGIWQSGSVIIRGRTVADAIEELRPWYEGQIILANDGVGAKRVTGIYRLSDPEEALRALVEPHGGTITRITPWLMIVS